MNYYKNPFGWNELVINALDQFVIKYWISGIEFTWLVLGLLAMLVVLKPHYLLDEECERNFA